MGGKKKKKGRRKGHLSSGDGEIGLPAMDFDDLVQAKKKHDYLRGVTGVNQESLTVLERIGQDVLSTV